MNRNAIIKAAIAAAIAMTALALPGCNAPEDTAKGAYLVSAEVACVEHCNDVDTIVCEDERGELYAFAGAGDSAGDTLTLMMHDQGTPEDILDDSIEDVRKASESVTI